MKHLVYLTILIILASCGSKESLNDPIAYLQNQPNIDFQEYLKAQIEISTSLSCENTEYYWDGKMGIRKCNENLTLYGYPAMVKNDIVGIQYIHHYKSEGRKIYKFTTYDLKKSEWSEVFNDLGRFLYYSDVDGDQQADVILDHREELEGRMVGSYQIHSTKHGNVLFDRYSIDSIASELAYTDYSFQNDSIYINTINSLKKGDSYEKVSDDLQAYKIEDYMDQLLAISNQIKSDPLNLNSFKNWLESNLSDFSNNKIVPFPFWYRHFGFDTYVPVDFYFPKQGDYGILLLRDYKDLGEPTYNYRIHVIENKLNVSEYLSNYHVNGEELECEQPIIEALKKDEPTFKISKPSCKEIPIQTANIKYSPYSKKFEYVYNEKEFVEVLNNLTLLESVFINLPEEVELSDPKVEAIIYEKNPLVKNLQGLNTGFDIYENSQDDGYMRYEYLQNSDIEYAPITQIKVWELSTDEYLIGRTVNVCEAMCWNESIEFFKTTDGKKIATADDIDFKSKIKMEDLLKEGNPCGTVNYIVEFDEESNVIRVVVSDECPEEHLKTDHIVFELTNDQFQKKTSE